jgi:hypothetical protein
VPAALSLEELVRGGGFRARRHRDLLADAPTLPWPQLAALQSAYVATEHVLERRAIGVAFERAVRTLNEDETERAARAAALAEFDQLVFADPEPLDLERMTLELDRWHDASGARYLRDRERLPWRLVADRLGVSVGKARRLVQWAAGGWKVAAAEKTERAGAPSDDASTTSLAGATSSR